MQVDLDKSINRYNNERPPSGRNCYGKTPIESFNASTPYAKEKMLDYTLQTVAN